MQINIFFLNNIRIFLFLFRGEKLYVTKDNRHSRRNSCRSVLCIIVGVTFIAAAIAVAALIGGKLIFYTINRELILLAVLGFTNL